MFFSAGNNSSPLPPALNRFYPQFINLLVPQITFWGLGWGPDPPAMLIAEPIFEIPVHCSGLDVRRCRRWGSSTAPAAAQPRSLQIIIAQVRSIQRIVSKTNLCSTQPQFSPTVGDLAACFPWNATARAPAYHLFSIGPMKLFSRKRKCERFVSDLLSLDSRGCAAAR